MLLREDISKIRESRESDYRNFRDSNFRDSENSLMFSTTRIMNASKEIDFILSENDVSLLEMPTIEELFNSKDFGKVCLDSHRDQQ